VVRAVPDHVHGKKNEKSTKSKPVIMNPPLAGPDVITHDSVPLESNTSVTVHITSERDSTTSSVRSRRSLPREALDHVYADRIESKTVSTTPESTDISVEEVTVTSKTDNFDNPRSPKATEDIKTDQHSSKGSQTLSPSTTLSANSFKDPSSVDYIATPISPFSFRIVFTGLLLCSFLSAVDQTIGASIVKPILLELGNQTLLPWMFSSYFIASSIAVLP
jgi:hypothetical protein